jgi:hypothetical protein
VVRVTEVVVPVMHASETWISSGLSPVAARAAASTLRVSARGRTRLSQVASPADAGSLSRTAAASSRAREVSERERVGIEARMTHTNAGR